MNRLMATKLLLDAGADKYQRALFLQGYEAGFEEGQAVGATAEREACAQQVESLGRLWVDEGKESAGPFIAAAALIRERGRQ